MAVVSDDEADIAEGRIRRHRDTGERLDKAEARTEAVWNEALGRFERRTHLEGHARAARILFPLFLLVLGACAVTLLHATSWSRIVRLWTFIFFYFAPGGLEFGIPIGVGLGISPFTMVAIILYADMVGALFLIWNLDVLDRVPKIGPWLRRLELKTKAKYEKRPWIEAWGLFGLGVYVAIPISVSGIIPGVIIGRIAGFPPGLVWLSVCTGAAVRVVVFVAVATGVKDLFF